MSSQLREGMIFSIGNPLLDIQAEVDQSILDKYNLLPNNAVLVEKSADNKPGGNITEESYNEMLKEIQSKYTVEYIPGGATQNSIRVAQWLIGHPNATTYMGCIGRDHYGEIIESKAKDAGVNVRYQYEENTPTGTCGVLITGQNRSLAAHLAAANCFKKSHLEKPENRQLMENANLFYMAGFPLTVAPDAMMLVAEHATSNNKLFAFNLSAPFICQFFKEPMMKLMPHVDILFGNETEALVFAREHQFSTEDLKEIALKIASLPKLQCRPRTVVITHGSWPTIVANDGKVCEFPVTKIDPNDIVDTNGAGDAFVGGYLAKLAVDSSMEDCIRAGHYAAHVIIQRSGCTLPEKPSNIN